MKSQMLSAPIDLDILLTYSLSPIPHCLGTPDGFFSKTNKASMLHFLMEDHNAEVQYPKDSMFIQDGNALFHTLVNMPPTFGGICLQILDLMASKKRFIFSTDSHHPESIKLKKDYVVDAENSSSWMDRQQEGLKTLRHSSLTTPIRSSYVKYY